MSRVPLQLTEPVFCAEGLGSYALQVPREPLQPVSLWNEPPLKLSLVPPTEITLGEADGYCAGSPESPEEAKKLTPVCEEWES